MKHCLPHRCLPYLQCSVRVDKGGGVPGRTMAEWLVAIGLETPREPSSGPGTSGSRDLIRSTYQNSSAAGGKSGSAAHRWVINLAMCQRCALYLPLVHPTGRFKELCEVKAGSRSGVR